MSSCVEESSLGIVIIPIGNPSSSFPLGIDLVFLLQAHAFATLCLETDMDMDDVMFVKWIA